MCREMNMLLWVCDACKMLLLDGKYITNKRWKKSSLGKIEMCMNTDKLYIYILHRFMNNKIFENASFRKYDSKSKVSPCIGAEEEHQGRNEGDGAGSSNTWR